MKKFLPLIVLLVFASASCKHTSSATSSGGGKDGSSFEKAIVITENTETKGVAAEYVWLKKNYPGYTLKQQSLVYNDGKPYDRMDIKTADGENKTIYFDISNFFGKF